MDDMYDQRPAEVDQQNNFPTQGSRRFLWRSRQADNAKAQGSGSQSAQTAVQQKEMLAGKENQTNRQAGERKYEVRKKSILNPICVYLVVLSVDLDCYCNEPDD